MRILTSSKSFVKIVNFNFSQLNCVKEISVSNRRMLMNRKMITYETSFQMLHWSILGIRETWDLKQTCAEQTDTKCDSLSSWRIQKHFLPLMAKAKGPADIRMMSKQRWIFTISATDWTATGWDCFHCLLLYLYSSRIMK